jgi:hypothetical protein
MARQLASSAVDVVAKLEQEDLLARRRHDQVRARLPLPSSYCRMLGRQLTSASCPPKEEELSRLCARNSTLEKSIDEWRTASQRLAGESVGPAPWLVSRQMHGQQLLTWPARPRRPAGAAQAGDCHPQGHSRTGEGRPRQGRSEQVGGDPQNVRVTSDLDATRASRSGRPVADGPRRCDQDQRLLWHAPLSSGL